MTEYLTTFKKGSIQSDLLYIENLYDNYTKNISDLQKIRANCNINEIEIGGIIDSMIETQINITRNTQHYRQIHAKMCSECLIQRITADLKIVEKYAELLCNNCYKKRVLEVYG